MKVADKKNVDEAKIMMAFMHYLENVLIVFEEPHNITDNQERIGIYYQAFKEAVLPLMSAK